MGLDKKGGVSCQQGNTYVRQCCRVVKSMGSGIESWFIFGLCHWYSELNEKWDENNNDLTQSLWGENEVVCLKYVCTILPGTWEVLKLKVVIIMCLSTWHSKSSIYLMPIFHVSFPFALCHISYAWPHRDCRTVHQFQILSYMSTFFLFSLWWSFCLLCPFSLYYLLKSLLFPSVPS